MVAAGSMGLESAYHQLGVHPQSYYMAYYTAIPKKGKDMKPLSQRMLTILTALYRVESKALFAKTSEFLRRTLHPDLHGGIAKHESLCVMGYTSRPRAGDGQRGRVNGTLSGLHEIL